jgi:hypothetical protein
MYNQVKHDFTVGSGGREKERQAGRERQEAGFQLMWKKK